MIHTLAKRCLSFIFNGVSCTILDQKLLSCTWQNHFLFHPFLVLFVKFYWYTGVSYDLGSTPKKIDFPINFLMEKCPKLGFWHIQDMSRTGHFHIFVSLASTHFVLAKYCSPNYYLELDPSLWWISHEKIFSPYIQNRPSRTGPSVLTFKLFFLGDS